MPFADVTGSRIPAPAVADASGWWAAQFRWRNPPVGDSTEATSSGLSEARVFWVWGSRSLTYWRQGAAAGSGLAGVPEGTAVPTPALAVGDRLVGRLDRYTLNGAAKQNRKHSYDSALLHLTGGAPMDGNIEYRVWPFGGFGPGLEYGRWWPLGAGGSRYVEIPGAGLYAGRPKGHVSGVLPLPARRQAQQWPLIWSFQVRRSATVVRANGNREEVYGPASNVVSLLLPYQGEPIPTATLFPRHGY